MKTEKTYKFKIEPNEKQKQQIIQNFGCVRFVHNYYLANRKIVYEMTGETFNYYDCSASLTKLKKKYPWLRDADSTSLQTALKNLDNAFQNFFRGCKTGKKIGYPKFKSRHHYRQTYTSKFSSGNIQIVDNKHIKLPKLGVVRCRLSREVKGRILHVTIEMSPAGKFYIAICCTDAEIELMPKTGKAIGIDLGLKDLATDSNGNKYPNPKYAKKAEKKLRREDRRLSRKTKDSHNYEKQRVKRAKAYEKTANMRKDAIQKYTTDIIRENDIICIEDLNPSGMMKNHHLAGAVSDTAFGEIRRELEYKAKWYGKSVIVIDRFFPSSQICSCCGYRDKTMRNLKKRTFRCPVCGLEIDRDENAAINIKNEGLRLLSEELTA